jgi:3-methyladenine DNA glycosylase AlkD
LPFSLKILNFVEKIFNMTKEDIMAYLEAKGSEQARKIYANHGAPIGNFFGVKVGDMKPIQKKIKKNHALSLELYATGNADAMYLAGLIADEKRISAAELDKWVTESSWYMLSEFTVAWVAAESPHGYTLGQKWIDNPAEKIAASGWSTLANWVALDGKTYDNHLIIKLLERVEKTIHSEQNRVRYAMNGFVIAVGTYITDLREQAVIVAQNIDKVSVNVGKTACKVPFAPDYIQYNIEKGRTKLKKEVRC